MEAVELPPVGMSWARAGLPALGPPPLKKGRSRQELMQREADRVAEPEQCGDDSTVSSVR